MSPRSLYPKDNRTFFEKHYALLFSLMLVAAITIMFLIAYTVQIQSPYSAIATI